MSLMDSLFRKYCLAPRSCCSPSTALAPDFKPIDAVVPSSSSVSKNVVLQHVITEKFIMHEEEFHGLRSGP